MADQLLATIFEQAGVALCLLSPDDRILMVNAEWQRATGFDARASLGANFFDLLPGTRELAVAVENRVLAGEAIKVPRHYEEILGRDSWWEGTVSPVSMPEGVGALITAFEVTGQVLAEQERDRVLADLNDVNWHLVLASTRQRDLALGAERMTARLSSLLESITDGFFALDREWRFTYVNAQAEKAFARKQGDLLGTVIWDELPEMAGPSFAHELRRSMENGIPVAFEEYYRPMAKWVEVRAYPTLEGLSVHFHQVGAETGAADQDYRLRQLSEQVRRQLRQIEDAIRRVEESADHPESVVARARSVLQNLDAIEQLLPPVEPSLPS